MQQLPLLLFCSYDCDFIAYSDNIAPATSTLQCLHSLQLQKRTLVRKWLEPTRRRIIPVLRRVTAVSYKGYSWAWRTGNGWSRKQAPKYPPDALHLNWLGRGSSNRGTEAIINTISADSISGASNGRTYGDIAELITTVQQMMRQCGLKKRKTSFLSSQWKLCMVSREKNKSLPLRYEQHVLHFFTRLSPFL